MHIMERQAKYNVALIAKTLAKQRRNLRKHLRKCLQKLTVHSKMQDSFKLHYIDRVLLDIYYTIKSF